MQHTTLPHTDFTVSTISFGGWGIAGGFNWGPQDDRDSIEALRTAFDCGITLFDTAEGYGAGKSEELFAKALRDVRQHIVIASKISPQAFAAADLKRSCEDRLRALRTDYIDLLQLHWPNWEVPLAGTLGALAELKQEGKIRAFGVSNFGTRDLQECLDLGAEVSSNQLPYSLLFRAIEYEVLPLCREAGVPVLAYMPIMQGLLCDKFKTADEVPEDRARTRHFARTRPQTRHQEEGAEEETFRALAAIRAIVDETGDTMANVSMAWLLAQEGMGSVIVGGRNAKQVKENVQVLALQLPLETIDRLNEATDKLKQTLGPNVDLWQTDSRIR
jgi:myo-inositol catabolism protein IolS